MDRGSRDRGRCSSIGAKEGLAGVERAYPISLPISIILKYINFLLRFSLNFFFFIL